MKREKLLKALAVLGLATTLTLTATAFVGCDNGKTHGMIDDPPIIVVDPPEPDKPITEPDDPVDDKPIDEPDEPDDPVIGEPDEPVIDEPDEPVIDEPDNPPDNPPEEEEQLTEAELKENENRIYKYVAKADNSGWETDSRGNPVEVFNKEGVRETVNDYLYSDYAGTGIKPYDAAIGLENEELLFTNYDEKNEIYQLGYLGESKKPDNYGNTKKFSVFDISVDLSDYETLDELTNYLSTYKPGRIDLATSYSYSYSNLDREYRSNRNFSGILKEKIYGGVVDDSEIIFEMYAEPFDGGVGYDFGSFMIAPMACIIRENNEIKLMRGSISSTMFYDGWVDNIMESEVDGTNCLNEDGIRVGVISRATPTPILTIDDNFYDAEDEIVLSVNKTNSRSNLKNIYVENKERIL